MFLNGVGRPEKENGMAVDTRQRILEAALDLFSQRGFEAVSVRDIAGAVGIRESSLYNHFRSKRDIFDTIVTVCWQKAEAYYRGKGLPFTKEEDLSVFAEQDFSRLLSTVSDTFRFFFTDPWNVRFRRLLLMSRFTDQRAADLYQRLYRDVPLEIQEKIFAGLMKSGQFRKSDPKTAALEFYGGVFLLLHTCESWDEAEPLLRSHLKEFLDGHRAG